MKIKKHIMVKNGKLYIKGEEYPPTRHNYEVYKQLCLTKDESLFDKFSKIVLENFSIDNQL